MAVVVQLQVRPVKCAGTLFTINPLNASSSEIFIQAVWGLGEGQVSGKYTGHSLVFDWTSNRVLRSKSSAQRRKLACREDRSSSSTVSEIPTTPAEASASPLTHDLAARLARMGVEVASFYGCPQDVEWAVEGSRLYLLQSRPVTSIQFSRDAGRWSMIHGNRCGSLGESLGGEAYARVVTDVLRCAATATSSSSSAPSSVALASYRMYFDRSYVSRDESERAETILRLPADADADVQRRSLEAYFETIFRRVRAIARASLPTSLKAARDAYASACELSWACGMAVAYFKERLESALDALECGEAFNVRDLIGSLSHQHSTSRQPSSELRAIARRYARDESVRAIFSKQADFDAASTFDRLEAVCPSCAKDLRAYVAKWGFMSANEEELGSVCWDDDPSLPLRFFGALLREALVADPRTSIASSVRVARVASRIRAAKARLARLSGVKEEAGERYVMVLEAETTTALGLFRRRHRRRWRRRRVVAYDSVRRVVRVEGGGTSGGEGDRSFDADSRTLSWNATVWDLLRSCKRGLVEKERIHVHYMKVGHRMKQLVARECKTLTSTTFFSLYASELDALLLSGGDSGAAAVANAAASRRRMFAAFDAPYSAGVAYAAATTPSVVVVPATSSHYYDGVGVSSGRRGVAEGVARVCRTLEDASELKRGEILVCEHTGPAWTPIFSLVGGVVMEYGGELSHGATVAREYGVPAVTIDDATSVFRSGQRLRVDGDRGEVKVL